MISFLDVLLIRNSECIDLAVFCKEINTDPVHKLELLCPRNIEDQYIENVGSKKHT